MSILRRIARHMRLERKASDRALHHKLDGALNDAGLPIRSAVDALRDAYFSIVHHAMTALLTIKMK